MTARIIDRGYRGYDGERAGRRHAIAVLWRHGVERSLGRRRPFWAKAVAGGTMILAYLPAVVFVGLAALLSDADLRNLVLPTYGEYYGFITMAIVLFSAFVAPELLCTDRRSGMLGIYLASPLDRSTYLLARAASIATVLAFVTLGPPLLLLVAYTFQGAGPDGVGGFVEVLLHSIGAAAVVTALMGSLSMAVSSSTDRNAVATAGVVLTLLISSATAAILVEEVGAPTGFSVFDLFGLPFEVASRIHGEQPDGRGLSELSALAVYGAAAGWTALFSTTVWWQYRRLHVRR